jgi:hypothetical protein
MVDQSICRRSLVSSVTTPKANSLPHIVFDEHGQRNHPTLAMVAIVN